MCRSWRDRLQDAACTELFRRRTRCVETPFRHGIADDLSRRYFWLELGPVPGVAAHVRKWTKTFCRQNAFNFHCGQDAIQRPRHWVCQIRRHQRRQFEDRCLDGGFDATAYSIRCAMEIGRHATHLLSRLSQDRTLQNVTGVRFSHREFLSEDLCTPRVEDFT